MVVLSVGLRQKPEAVDLARRLEIDLDEYAFPKRSSFAPVKTNVAGVFVCGAFQGPKDIPTSVIDASAAAAEVASSLAPARRSLTKTKEWPAERGVIGDPPRVGVFVCHCGTNIAGVVDVEAVAEYAAGLPYVAHVERNLFSCSQDSQEKIAKVIAEENLNRVVVAACTPRTHEPLFQETLTAAGLNKYLFEMANIRNQCSWVHADDPAKATLKAKDLVRMAVAKASQLAPAQESELAVNQNALVIGGGLAGMAAAKNLSDQGFHTFLVERSERLGGQALSLSRTWAGEAMGPNLEAVVEAVEAAANIEVLLEAEITGVEGFVGNFKTTLQAEGQERVLEHGVAIIATGASELKPKEHLYGEHDDVLTGLELSRRIKEGDPKLKEINTAVFLQCVGSRIPERPYCSRVCCTRSILSALELKEINPQVEVYVVYRDMRPYGLREDLYRRARQEGVHFIRYEFEQPLTVRPKDGRLEVEFTDYVLQRRLILNPDKLILAAAMVPPQEQPLAQMFKVPLNEDRFFVEAHVKLRPVDFATDGVFVCGLAHAPKSVDESIVQAQAAAGRAAIILSRPSLAVGGITSFIDPARCVGCGVCIQVCPFQAIAFDEKQVAMVNEALCKGCGNCVSSCRSSAPQLRGFTDAGIFAQIEAC